MFPGAASPLPAADNGDPVDGLHTLPVQEEVLLGGVNAEVMGWYEGSGFRGGVKVELGVRPRVNASGVWSHIRTAGRKLSAVGSDVGSRSRGWVGWVRGAGSGVRHKLVIELRGGQD